MSGLIFNKPWIPQWADPYVYRHADGTYYFNTSVPEYDDIRLRWDKDGRPIFSYDD